MKKEVLLAIILGIIVGLVVTFGIYTANRAIRQRQEQSNDTKPEVETFDENTPRTSIVSPENGAIVDQEQIQIAGTTIPNAIVVIFVGEEQQITNADGTGNFSAQLELQGGSNIITTIVTAEDGTQETDERVVVYSTADLDEVASPSAEPRPSPTPTTDNGNQ